MAKHVTAVRESPDDTLAKAFKRKTGVPQTVQTRTAAAKAARRTPKKAPKKKARRK